MADFFLIAAGVWFLVALCNSTAIGDWAWDVSEGFFGFLLLLTILLLAPIGLLAGAIASYDPSPRCAELSVLIGKPTVAEGFGCLVEISEGVWIDKDAIRFDTAAGRK